MMIFAPLDGSASLVTSSSSRSVFPVPSSSMTLRNRNKGKTPVSISSLLVNSTVGDDQKDETSTSLGDQGLVEDGAQSASCLSSTAEDTLIERKKLPRVILRLGKPPDKSV